MSPTCLRWCPRAGRWLLFKSRYWVIAVGSSVTHSQKFIDAAGGGSRKTKNRSLLTSRAFWGRFWTLCLFFFFLVQNAAESYAGHQTMVCLLIPFQERINFCCFPAAGDFLRRGWGLGNSILFDPMCEGKNGMTPWQEPWPWDGSKNKCFGGSNQ